jgi:hypothetical protein
MGIILKWTKKCDGDKDWIDMAQDTDRWRAVVNVLTKLSGSITCRELLN